MLVLSRYKGESIMIGDITVMIIDIRGDKVRLAVEAPRDVPVHRKEVYDTIQREKAAQSPTEQPTAVCAHVWGIDGAHSNEYCKKCFINKQVDSQETKE